MSRCSKHFGLSTAFLFLHFNAEAFELLSERVTHNSMHWRTRTPKRSETNHAFFAQALKIVDPGLLSGIRSAHASFLDKEGKIEFSLIQKHTVSQHTSVQRRHSPPLQIFLCNQYQKQAQT